MRYLLFLLFSINIFGQQINIIDSLDQKAIPYSRIYTKDKLMVTDSAGSYNLVGISDSIIKIVSTEYHSKTITKTGLQFPKEVFLQPIINNIDEVKIRNSKNFTTTEIRGFPKIKKSSSIALDNRVEFAIKIESSESDCFLKNIKIPIKKTINNLGYIIADIYLLSDDFALKKINQEKISISVKDLLAKKSIIINENIMIEKNKPFYVSILWIENLKENSDEFSNQIFIYTKSNDKIGKMKVRKSNYIYWDDVPDFSDENVALSIIPAITVESKCFR